MSQPASRSDELVAARIASCLTLAIAAGAERLDATDRAGKHPFLIARLQGGLEALLAVRRIPGLAERCGELGWYIDGEVPFRALSDSVGATPVLSAQDHLLAVGQSLMACIRARAEAPAAASPEDLDYRLGAALDYLAGARVLSDADAAGGRELLHRRGVVLSDPIFSNLYEALNLELEDVNRRRYPINYTWRGRLFRRFVIRPIVDAAKRSGLET